MQLWPMTVRRFVVRKGLNAGWRSGVLWRWCHTEVLSKPFYSKQRQGMHCMRRFQTNCCASVRYVQVGGVLLLTSVTTPNATSHREASLTVANCTFKHNNMLFADELFKEETAVCHLGPQYQYRLQPLVIHPVCRRLEVSFMPRQQAYYTSPQQNSSTTELLYRPLHAI